MKKNKIKSGDILYKVEINQLLLIEVYKSLITKVKGDTIHHKTISYDIIDDYILTEEQQDFYCLDINRRDYGFEQLLKPYKTSGGECGPDDFCTEKELEKVIESSLAKQYESNNRRKEYAEKFRCPITGGRMIKIPRDPHVLTDGIGYRVDGQEIKWGGSSRIGRGRILSTSWKGKDYTFKYLEEGEWEEQIKIDWCKYVKKPETPEEQKEVDELIAEVKIKEEESKKRLKEAQDRGDYPSIMPIVKQVFSKLSKTDIVKVKPMDMPKGVLNYMDYGNGKDKTEIVMIKFPNDNCEMELKIDIVKEWKIKVDEKVGNTYFCKHGESSFSIKEDDLKKVNEKLLENG